MICFTLIFQNRTILFLQIKYTLCSKEPEGIILLKMVFAMKIVCIYFGMFYVMLWHNNTIINQFM